MSPHIADYEYKSQSFLCWIMSFVHNYHPHHSTTPNQPIDCFFLLPSSFSTLPLIYPYFPRFHTFVKMVRVSFAILLTLMAGSALALPQVQEGGEILSITTSTDIPAPTSGSNPQGTEGAKPTTIK